jgi:hypothetical protein
MIKLKISMFFYALFILSVLSIFVSSKSYSEGNRYDPESCDGMFRFVSGMVEESSKAFPEDEQKSMMYSQLAANFAQIYSVFCDDKKIESGTNNIELDSENKAPVK